jgi:hypothetical protein
MNNVSAPSPPGMPSLEPLISVMETLKTNVLDQLMGLKDKIMDVVLLILAYIQYYGGVAGILFMSYLTILLVNTSVSGSAIGLVIQPWLGLVMVAIALAIVFGYLYFVPKPDAVVGVDFKSVMPGPPQAPSLPGMPGMPGMPSLPSLPF